MKAKKFYAMLPTPLLSLSPAAFLWQYAAAVAAEAHDGQTPPGSGMPYFAHPSRVALIVSAVFGCHDQEVLATALLHDVLEKTKVNREGMAIAMGANVASWVEYLSKTSPDEKKIYWQRLAASPWQARLVKMADALDHLNGPPEYLAERLKSAHKALALATSAEPEIQRASAALRDAIEALSSLHNPQ
ncbi:HD domain-containing protein [Luteolibacter sp. GHJ8]|uniref:HD domain-containing protein n=1 Tax=Luteolibacter rhizosphaerae TaxID=2989719 RepID=A0ABT3G7P7_9BACT|nr:HD domain-containing protein [Luteolibacter rhizosphaerae]MCW1915877.1 HD domain-containing protein [Luteolibacter rhizosphaerae]